MSLSEKDTHLIRTTHMPKCSSRQIALVGAASSLLLLSACNATAKADSTPIDENSSVERAVDSKSTPAEMAAHQMHARMSSHEYHEEHQKRMEAHGPSTGASSMGMDKMMQDCANSQEACPSKQDGMKAMSGMKTTQGTMRPMKGKMKSMNGMQSMDSMSMPAPKETKQEPAPMPMHM
jgi:hypothetical protein